MSAAASAWAWSVRGIAPVEKLLLACLADHADKRGENAFPGTALLQEETGIPERTVRLTLRTLETAGLIRRTANAAGGRGKTVVYALAMDDSIKGAAPAAFTGDEKAATESVQDAKGGGKAAERRQKGGEKRPDGIKGTRALNLEPRTIETPVPNGTGAERYPKRAPLDAGELTAYFCDQADRMMLPGLKAERGAIAAAARRALTAGSDPATIRRAVDAIIRGDDAPGFLLKVVQRLERGQPTGRQRLSKSEAVDQSFANIDAALARTRGGR